MGNYIPPYTISEKMLEQVSAISEKVGKITSHRELESKPHLRRNNRIRSIHSSLKIEANSLSLNEVKLKGAKLVHLDTFDFQAKDFYLKQGYEIFGKLEDCPENHCRYYMKKALQQIE